MRSRRAGSESTALLEAALCRENLMAAYRRVVRNKGAAGIDGVTVDELWAYCQAHWPSIRERLLEGRYRPSPVREVRIPKPGGGSRALGIPTVIDRLIQQALVQVLSPILDPTFSGDSYGFRPGRSAHQAVERARGHVAAGRRWVVDLDLAQFFDRVNHDVLMARLARRIKDKRVLRLIRRYLQAGVMAGGVVSPRAAGTPQGGPLSPLLSNVLLDELDRELERRGHRFVRHADDVSVYVCSPEAGARVLASLERFLWRRLRLVVNREKSAVDRPWKRTLLGYTMTAHREPKLRVAPSSVQRLKARLRAALRRGRGRNLQRVLAALQPVIRGWVAYFRLAETKAAFEALDQWLRRRLRCLLWRQWKHWRTRARRLMQHGVERLRAYRSATNGRGPWWNAGAAHMHAAIPARWLHRQGLVSFLGEHRRLASTT
ncbi:group II intron reverse transcriptase/maturase [Sediminicurvatus halobius]|uniref:group II intron reverse transcriptase/maturase n=1 Tax=Sediminicurvatus halobius TaxID=2182432 RepID=UPI001E5F0FFE|nr:group II intron reverse transcriptase/maturase [Spiribacter halobius]UEX77310.1 group II intron reverse transcriptase/maturase [Spiribacter halobius]